MNKIQYIGIKKDNLPFRVVSSVNFKKELNLLPVGRYRVTVEKWRKNKSNPQLGYYYGCVLPLFLQGAIDAGWEITSIEECDIWLKSMFANKNLINRNTGQIVSVPALKREMTTTEMSTFTNQVRDFAAEYLTVFIPDPESQTYLNFDKETFE